MDVNPYWEVEPVLLSCAPDPHVFDQLCQAAVLYIKLHALRYNPDASAEASLAIHHWIGEDSQRQAAYDRVRKVLYHKGDWLDAAVRRHPTRFAGNPVKRWLSYGPAGGHGLASGIRSFWVAGNGNLPALDKVGRMAWPDVVSLLFAFLLLLPMIYFLAVPIGN